MAKELSAETKLIEELNRRRRKGSIDDADAARELLLQTPKLRRSSLGVRPSPQVYKPQAED